MDGAVIDDVNLRETLHLAYRPFEFPAQGWGGGYPSATQMQFMAYYDGKIGLYFGAHDAENQPKGIEYHGRAEGTQLDFRSYPGGVERGTYTFTFEVVLGVFEGDWHDPAEIYREWVEKSGPTLPAAGETALPK
jgi:hypothetical protein